jgi:hypothetical protein
VILVAARPDGRTVGVAAHVGDVGIRSRDAAVSHDVAFLHGVLWLVHAITVVLGHLLCLLRIGMSQAVCRAKWRCARHV